MRRLHPRCSSETIGRWYWRYLGVGVPRNTSHPTATLAPGSQRGPIQRYCRYVRPIAPISSPLFLCTPAHTNHSGVRERKNPQEDTMTQTSAIAARGQAEVRLRIRDSAEDKRNQRPAVGLGKSGRKRRTCASRQGQVRTRRRLRRTVQPSPAQSVSHGLPHPSQSAGCGRCGAARVSAGAREPATVPRRLHFLDLAHPHRRQRCPDAVAPAPQTRAAP